MSGTWSALSKYLTEKGKILGRVLDHFLCGKPSEAECCKCLYLKALHLHKLGPCGLSPFRVFVDISSKRLKAQLSSIYIEKSDFHLLWELTRCVMIFKLPLDKF